MAGVREDRPRLLFPQSASTRRPLGILVVALIAVLAAIALVSNVSRRATHRAAAPVAMAETPPAAPEPAAQAVPAEQPAAVPVEPAAPELSAASQAEIGRVISDGRPGLAACYQRALVRDETLLNGHVAVRVSVAASGRVDTVNIKAPPAFRVLSPCLKRAVSRWTFPAASAPYETDFPLVLRAMQ
jgi:hypothetical protein